MSEEDKKEETAKLNMYLSPNDVSVIISCINNTIRMPNSDIEGMVQFKVAFQNKLLDAGLIQVKK